MKQLILWRLVIIVFTELAKEIGNEAEVAVEFLLKEQDIHDIGEHVCVIQEFLLPDILLVHDLLPFIILCFSSQCIVSFSIVWTIVSINKKY